jgi:hypothetical protein
MKVIVLECSLMMEAVSIQWVLSPKRRAVENTANTKKKASCRGKPNKIIDFYISKTRHEN